MEQSAAQYLLNINDIWTTVDPNMSLHPNQLQSPENIETRFLPTREKLVENKDKDPKHQTVHIQAKTIKGKLQSLIRLTDFLRDRHVYVGLTRQDLGDIKLFIGHLQKNLKDLILEREHSIREFKSNIFINAEDFQKYGNSDYVKDIVDLLNKVDKEGEEANICLKEAIDVRDHLILTFINSLRASNIINITLKEVQAAKKHDEFHAFVFKNNIYKTSLIYGEKW